MTMEFCTIMHHAPLFVSKITHVTLMLKLGIALYLLNVRT